ncbi:DUF3383 family protein [Paenibacillus sp. 2RAB27]|uniref:DUF3383 family protein n=1 Tax=Paenibacillus sp. 2RAB27 TaxID=3232991 RepID=UPI003F98E029
MTQSISSIVNVSVIVSPLSTVNGTFNLGLIIGKSTLITPLVRVKTYTSPDAMISDGWAGTEPEYLAAQIYFSANPRPNSVAIGRWDGTGSETAAQAITACRAINSDWYACFVVGAVKTDIVAAATAVESMTPLSTYFYNTADSEVTAGTTNNVMDTLKKAKRHRSFGQFSNDPYAAAATLGYAMGANTGLANSAYSLAYKSLPGVNPELSLTPTQVDTILGYSGNVYTNYGATYNLLVQGTMADGIPFDEVLNIDVLTSNIQRSVMNALTTAPKIPQTEDGVSQLVGAITTPCNDARTRGILAPGTWKGATIGGLKTGDTLSAGFLILADTLANQSQADRDARKSPPIYVAVKMAGAIEHVVIGIIVNR